MEEDARRRFGRLQFVADEEQSGAAEAYANGGGCPDVVHVYVVELQHPREVDRARVDAGEQN